MQSSLDIEEAAHYFEIFMLLADSDQTRCYKVADACYMGMYHAPASILNQLNVDQLINFCVDDFDKGNDNTELYYYEKPLWGHHHCLQWVIIGAIKQDLSLIHFELVTTAHLDAINEVKDSEQTYKQVKCDVEMPVIPFIFSISSEPSTLSAPDLIPAVSIV